MSRTFTCVMTLRIACIARRPWERQVNAERVTHNLENLSFCTPRLIIIGIIRYNFKNYISKVENTKI